MRIKIFLILLTLACATVQSAVLACRRCADRPVSRNILGQVQTRGDQGDKESVANMSEFPIGMPYGFRKIKTKLKCSSVTGKSSTFRLNAVKCFADARPTVDATAKNRFTIGCKDKAGNETVVYGFVKTRGIWKFKYLDNLNE
jgi:hypothetical protein